VLDELPVRRYASQGQHRTFGMALKLAQYDYLQERGRERPILLLDDVFDNLDPARIEAFLAILGSEAIGQSVTTAARREIVHNHLEPTSCRTIDVLPGARVREPDPRPDPDDSPGMQAGTLTPSEDLSAPEMDSDS
jgi:DNA replication and repair protein RecF